MLTIKAPIELTCRPSIVSSNEAFYHRILGNYGVIGSGIDREDLLHALTMPIEIYLGEGGMTNLVQHTQIQNSQENKLTMINNLLNRIAVMEEVHLTYQDRVYITDVLQRLGVQDIKQFMKQVSQIKQKTQTTEQLISLYWNHLEELTQLVREYQTKESTHKTQKETIKEERLHLHEEITHRLKTAAIYQILHNFYTSHHQNSVSVTQAELQIAEQKQVAIQVLLNQLKQEVQQQPLPLQYQYDNYYETLKLSEEEHVEEALNSQITSAVLLNVIDRLYLSRFERQQYQYNTWLSMEHALYQSAENTLYRLQANYLSSTYRQQEQYLDLKTQQKLQVQEIEVLQQLLMTSWESKERLYTLQERYDTEGLQIWHHNQEQATIPYAIEENPIETEETADLKEETRADTDIQKTKEPSTAQDAQSSKDQNKNKSSEDNQSSAVNRIPVQTELLEQVLQKASNPEQISSSRQGESSKNPPAQMVLPGFDTKSDLIYDTSIEESIQWIQEEQRQLDQLIEQYLTSFQSLHQERLLTTETQAQSPIDQAAITAPLPQPEEQAEAAKEKAAKAAQTVLLQWQEQKTQNVQLTESKTTEQEGDLFTSKHYAQNLLYETQNLEQNSQTVQQQYLTQNRTDVQNIHHTHLHGGEEAEQAKPSLEHPIEETETLEQQLLQINQQNIANYNAYQELLKEQKRAQKKRPPSVRDMRVDSLKALKDPDALRQEYQKEREEAELQKQSETRQMLSLLPEQTRRIYQRLEQYLSAPKSSTEDTHRPNNDTARLLYDIHQAEADRIPTESERIETLQKMQDTSYEVLEKWKESAAKETPFPPIAGRTSAQNPLSFVHKSTESQLNEELLQYLMEQNRTEKGKMVVTTEEAQNHQVVKTTVQNMTHQVLEQKTEDLTELIQKGVRQQMGVLSEQIYSKLEKKLQNEKKRRGY